MVSFKNSNLEIIRDFSEEQFIAHIQLMEDIRSENDFGDIGVHKLLDNYLELSHKNQEEHKTGKEEFTLSKNEVFLYDMVVEIARLCYKHSYETSADHNDWEEEF